MQEKKTGFEKIALYGSAQFWENKT